MTINVILHSKKFIANTRSIFEVTNSMCDIFSQPYSKNFPQVEDIDIRTRESDS